jgi:hypothetical protein
MIFGQKTSVETHNMKKIDIYSIYSNHNNLKSDFRMFWDIYMPYNTVCLVVATHSVMRQAIWSPGIYPDRVRASIILDVIMGRRDVTCTSERNHDREACRVLQGYVMKEGHNIKG